MTIFIELIAGFAWLFGANGFLIEQQVAATPGLPSIWVQPVATHSEVVFHPYQDWPMAFYLPPTLPDFRLSDYHLSGERPSDRQSHRPAPNGWVESGSPTGIPRVFLFAPYYLGPDGLIEASRMPVDVAEYYFHALIEARLEHEMHLDGSGFAQTVDRRANELMADVPPQHRQAAYLDATADFGAHLFSIANEISRVARRQGDSGRNLCRLIERPMSLFGLWRSSFKIGSYPGRYPLDDPTSDSTLRWTTSHRALARTDKLAFVREILDDHWSGDPSQDFEWICPRGGTHLN